MGSQASRIRGGRRAQASNGSSNGGDDARIKPKILPPDILTEEEINCIKLTWPYLSPNVKPILTKAFLALFEESPDIKDKFVNFRNMTVQDLKKSSKDKDSALSHHIPLVARALVKMINHVENLDNVLDYAECIGKIHHKNKIYIHEIATLGPFFVTEATKHLPTRFRYREDVQEAWLRLFVVICDLFKRGYPNYEVDLNLEEKIIIRRTHKIIQNQMRELGVATFIALFKEHSTSKLFFPVFKDSPLEDLTLSENLKDHGQRLMKVLDNYIATMDTPKAEEMEVSLVQLGCRHQKMGIEKKYLDVMGPIFCETIRPVLQEEEEWNQSVRHAWLHLFRIIVLKVKRGYKHSSTGQSSLCSGSASLSLSLPPRPAGLPVQYEDESSASAGGEDRRPSSAINYGAHLEVSNGNPHLGSNDCGDAHPRDDEFGKFMEAAKHGMKQVELT